MRWRPFLIVAAGLVAVAMVIPLNQISALFGQQTANACVDALRQARERREQQTSGPQSPT